MVDLERRMPIALLPDRDADSLASFLKENPSLEIVS